jgi:hypothetical protein
MLPDTCLQEMCIHAQAEETVIEKEMSADDTHYMLKVLSVLKTFSIQ